MNGFVDSAGRALLDISLKPTADAEIASLTAWIDTGFTGDLVLPQAVIDDWELPLSGTVGAVLADGSITAMKIYSCLIQWFDEWQHLEIVGSDAKYPLLGVGLLLDHQLRIDYQSKLVTLE